MDIREFRQLYNLSRKELAKELGVVQSYISDIENGKKPISDSMLYKLEKFASSFENVHDSEANKSTTSPIYGDRIKEIRRYLNLSQRELSDALGISVMALSRLETGESSLKIEIISKFDNLDINTDWLITGKGEMFRSDGDTGLAVYEEKETNLTVQERGVSMPFIDISASAGFGVENFDEMINESVKVVISPNLLPNISLKDTFVVKAKGDSMLPVINNGDLLVVRQFYEVPNLLFSGTCLVFYHGAHFVKNVAITGTGVKLLSNNPQYDPIVIDGKPFDPAAKDNSDSDFRIIGEVLVALKVTQISFA